MAAHAEEISVFFLKTCETHKLFFLIRGIRYLSKLKKYLKLSSYLLFWNECNKVFFHVVVKRSQWHFILVNRVTTPFLCLQTSL